MLNLMSFVQLEDPKEAAKDILARAAAKGLLGNRPEKKATRLEKARSEVHPHETEEKSKRRRGKKGKGAKGASVCSHSHKRTTKVAFGKTVTDTPVTVSTRLYSPPEEADTRSLPVKSAPHVAVIQHPAPFR